MPSKLLPPVAKVQEQKTLHHGVQRSDAYAWLRAENWREVMQSPDSLPSEIKDYIEAENAYTHSVLADTQTLQSKLFEELKQRIEEDYQSVPDEVGDYAYYIRYQSGQQHPICCRHALRAPDDEEVLLDCNEEAKRSQYFHLGDCEPSPDHTTLAYTADTDGSEFYKLTLRPALSAEPQAPIIDNVQGEVVWSNDSQYLFYIVLDEEHRPEKVCRHRINSSSEEDVVVYEESDKGFFIGLGKTHSKRFITIGVHDHETSEVYLIDADQPCSEPRLVRRRSPGVEYEVEHHGDRLLIRTNADGAKDYKMVAADLADPGEWTAYYTPGAGVLLEEIEVFEAWLVRYERQEGLPRLVVRELATEQEHTIAFDEECYDLSIEECDAFVTDTLRFSYSSMTTPEEIYDYDMRQRSRVLRKQQQVPSGHTPSDYVSRRFLVPAHDGQLIPLSILHAKAHPPSKESPLLLYGYGAYGHIIPDRFSTARLSLVDRGFVFAIAHIRGGMEKGYHWYENGKLQDKENTFKDFISCASYVIDQGMTSSQRLAIHGGSAGGMLIGAVLNMRSDLFAAALADVPFVDVLATMLDTTLPLTPPEWVEWGNPIEDEVAYRRIAAYSPYDNVAAQTYPHTLVTAGLSDPRVTYWEAAKWVAKLRAKKRDDNLLLLKTNMAAGHGGLSGRYDALKEVALQYAFLLKLLAPAAKDVDG